MIRSVPYDSRGWGREGAQLLPILRGGVISDQGEVVSSAAGGSSWEGEEEEATWNHIRIPASTNNL